MLLSQQPLDGSKELSMTGLVAPLYGYIHNSIVTLFSDTIHIYYTSTVYKKYIL